MDKYQFPYGKGKQSLEVYDDENQFKWYQFPYGKGKV